MVYCSFYTPVGECFLGRVKNEVSYGRDWKGWTLDDFMYFIDRYLRWSGMKGSRQSVITEVQMNIELNLV